MKEKGFTLVELIAVLVILSIIVLVAFPNILKTMKRTDELMTSATKELLTTNARSYFNDREDFNESTAQCVNVATLIKEGYTQTPISSVRSTDSAIIEKDWSVKATYNGEKWIFDVRTSKC